MAICLDCAVHQRKLCDVHALTDNLHDELDDQRVLLLQAQVALEDCQRPDHRPPCGTCAELIRKISRFFGRGAE